MVDPARVRRLLQTLDSYRRELEPLAALSVEAYRRDEAFSGRYLVQAVAQACIDIASHVIASEGWRTPSDFRDAFTVLHENNVMEPELAEKLRSLAGLRNRLVHLYDEIDDSIVHASIAECLRDTDAFAAAVARLL